MERAITRYHQDDEGDWVAELACGHNQHVRHSPPFQLRAWVTEERSRMAKLGTPLDCPLCDRAELPDALDFVRSSPKWTEHTVPSGLLHAHRLAHGTWGLIAVQRGQLRFVMSAEPAIDAVLGPGSSQAIPPTVEHHVQPLGPVRFKIDFLGFTDRHTTTSDVGPEPGPSAEPHAREEGGDPACWAGLLCPDCGTVLDEGEHRKDCPAST